MSRPTITIVGLGLIGTSIGLALQRARPDQFDLVGHDKNLGRAKEARSQGAVNKVDWNLIGACDKANLVIIATPLEGVRETLEAMANQLQEGCVIMDTANVKGPVMGWAGKYLPDSVSFIGTNPILYADGQGKEAARPELFQDALWCVFPSPNATPEAVKTVTDLIQLLGARSYFLDPLEHDGLAAVVDHLPLLLAAALLRLTFGAATWKELRQVAGVIYESATRLPSNDAGFYRDIVLHNRDNVLRWLDSYLEELRAWRKLVADSDAAALAQVFDKAIDARILWQEQRKEGFPDVLGEKIELPTVGGFFDNLLGFGALRKVKKEKSKK